MSTVPEPDFFFNNPYSRTKPLEFEGNEFYSEAKMILEPGEGKWSRGRAVWAGNFFPDMTAWDKLVPSGAEAPAAPSSFIKFAEAEMHAHMSVFDPQLYKKGHRHGPGRVIVIPKGEGYSILWPTTRAPKRSSAPGRKPPSLSRRRTGTTSTSTWAPAQARYLALSPIPQFQGRPYSHQIEYPDEEPVIRDTFESELAKRGMESLMVKQAYEDREYEWDYGADN